MRREKQLSAMVNKLIKDISIENRKNLLCIERMMKESKDDQLMIELSYILEKIKSVRTKQ